MNELSGEARQLIQLAVQGDGPSGEQRLRVRRRLLFKLGAGAALVHTTSAAASAAGNGVVLAPVAAKVSVNMGSLLSSLLVGALIGTGVSAPSVVWSEPTQVSANAPLKRESGAPARAVAPGRAKTRGAVDLPLLNDEAESSRGLISEISPSVPAPGARSVITSTNSAVISPSPVTPAPAAGSPGQATASMLRDELNLLNAAHQELAAGHAAEAEQLVERQAKQYPNGALHEEGLAVRVLALCELGDTESARSAAKTFFALAPESPLVPRIRESCAGTGSAKSSNLR